MKLLALVVACAMLVPATARAEEDAPRPKRRAPAIGAAVVPGLLLHGSGHWVAGERATARRMLAIEAAAIAAIGAGLVPLALANRRTSWPAIPLVVSGTGVLIGNWLGDLYGSAGAADLLGRPAERGPDIAIQSGYGFVHDPRLQTGSFGVLGAEGRLGRWGAAAGAWLGRDNQRISAGGDRRILGSPRGTGSHLELRGRVRYHRYAEDFTIAGAEVEVGGRLDLARLAPTLAGSFAELSTGLGLDVVDYRIEGIETDVWDALVGGFAWGLYLGAGRGEARVFYDHRRDGFAAGLATGNRGNGFLGHFGAELDLRLAGPWGLHASTAIGSAWVAHLALRYSIGGSR